MNADTAHAGSKCSASAIIGVVQSSVEIDARPVKLFVPRRKKADVHGLSWILAGVALVVVPAIVYGQSVPDALSVEWDGKKPCEKLHEDVQILVARCTFPPGSMHVKHRHPAYLSYVLSGGRAKLEDEKGVREVDVKTGALGESTPIVHELTNVGTTTLQYLVVEKKYSQ